MRKLQRTDQSQNAQRNVHDEEEIPSLYGGFPPQGSVYGVARSGAACPALGQIRSYVDRIRFSQTVRFFEEIQRMPTLPIKDSHRQIGRWFFRLLSLHLNHEINGTD